MAFLKHAQLAGSQSEPVLVEDSLPFGLDTDETQPIPGSLLQISPQEPASKKGALRLKEFLGRFPGQAEGFTILLYRL